LAESILPPHLKTSSLTKESDRWESSMCSAAKMGEA
jgi:hypothetical protein